MPIYRLLTLKKAVYCLIWLIDETEEELLAQLIYKGLAVEIQGKIAHKRKRLEHIATRLALEKLCNQLGHTYQGIVKDLWGKPYLVNSHLQISLTHSFPFAAAAISYNSSLGIDLELPNWKLHSLSDKYLNPQEKEDSNQDLEKLTIYWCAKEALYKAYGGKNLSLREDMHIKPFIKSPQGSLEGQVRGIGFDIQYTFMHTSILAWCQEKK